MRRWMPLSLLLLGCMPAFAMEPASAQRILFVGNSLTYVGNLPATFAAMARANGHDVHSAMIVQGGATLAQRMADGSVRRALVRYRPAVLVLQERGGDLVCLPDEEACRQSRQAVRTLARAGREAGARVLLLGSYPSLPRASAAIVEEERAAATQAGIGYIEISESLRRLSGKATSSAWYDADGMHPGPALTLLDATQLHRALFGTFPAQGFLVAAPIYTPDSRLHAELRDADAPAPRPDTPQGIRYDATMLEQLGSMLDYSDKRPR
ncbi:SGNH/GDSL hydrolase family protein [Stenotrophomonas mori]|uniref:SGNH/GDSL hydrolase family protein n=1 Tax=Stenotrophomonas mori TaxID=2871096 RepID=A0ABT0SDK5_9GAMM|nr:SGNH/GDSL hydrolase family protein [Stenotrophomonas mori]MCL7713382.1 SGNH/GDSL hydrolase family protein [Stenotrophomonas mori]